MISRTQELGSTTPARPLPLAWARVAGAVSRTEPDLSGVVARIAEGDAGAVRTLYEHLGGRLLDALRRMVGDRVVAEDLLQDVFVSVWRHASSYRPDRGEVAGWVYTIARNRAADHLRRRGRRASGHEVEATPEDLDLSETPRDPAAGLGVRRLLGDLRTEERQALELTYFGGFSHREAADRLDVPLGTFKSWVRMGLHRLRERMTA